MEILLNVPDFQLNFEKISQYFQYTRSQLAKEAPNAETIVEPTNDEANSSSSCVCIHRKVYFPHDQIVTYKRLLAKITAESESGNPEELPEFQDFFQLHQELQNAQKEAVEELQLLSPCGHLVLPIELEESFLNYLYAEQLNRNPTGIYKFMNQSRFQIGRATTTSLSFIRSFGKDSSLPSFKLKDRVLSRSLSANPKGTDEGGWHKYAMMHPDVNIIASTEALVDLTKYLDSKTKCFFPVEVIPSPFDKDKRVAILSKPIFAELPQDNRMRAKDCYTALCREHFFETPARSSDSLTTTIPFEMLKKDSICESESPNLVIEEHLSEESISDFTSPHKSFSENFSEILNRCHVVENREANVQSMDILDQPASPSSPTLSPKRLSPSHSPVHAPDVVTIPTRLEELICDRFWNLFKLGPQRLLVSSCGVKFSPSSCPFETDCPYFPKCSEMWSERDRENSQHKIVYLEVRPEYLQPWGCEVLSEEEVFASMLGAQLSCINSPTILRLRVEASTGRVIFAEVQPLDQLKEMNHKFKFETHLARLMNVLSPLSRLQVGKYLLPSKKDLAGSRKKYQIYELINESDRSASKSSVDLRQHATEAFQAAALQLISSTESSDHGSNWRVVKRLPLDIHTPSGLDGENLRIPAIDTGFLEDDEPEEDEPAAATVEERPLPRRSPRKKTMSSETSQSSSFSPKRLKIESPSE